MISAGIEGRLPYMTYPEPWGGPPKQQPEFLRPAPKPLPPTRYNGMSISTSLNGTRIASAQAQRSPSGAPVNLSQAKQEDAVDEIQYSTFPRLFGPPPHFTYHTTGPYATLYQPPFTPILRTGYAAPTQSPLSPLETKYSPTTLSPSATIIHSAPSTFTSTVVLQQQQIQQQQQQLLHQQQSQLLQHQQQQFQQLPQTTTSSAERKPSPSFKVPSGKEGSLKHRILTRPGDAVASRTPLELERLQQDAPKLSEGLRKRLTATASPPKSPAKTVNNNVVPTATFTKGSLIQLANGELRKVEELRTEDFVNSAERSPELRLADSTVVRLKENPALGTATITLTYNQRRTQVEFETNIEHPFFVYGQGWASCAPERTLQAYGLKVHRLLVGDILISLTPRENASMPISTKGTTIITTATTTAVTARQVSATNTQHAPPASYNSNSHSKNQLSPDYVGNSNKKRRWSAPDQICDEDEQISRRVKI